MVELKYVERGQLMQVWYCPLLLIFPKCSEKSCFVSTSFPLSLYYRFPWGRVGENAGNEVGFLCQFKCNFYLLSLIKRPKTYSTVFPCFMLQKVLAVFNCKKTKEVNIHYNVIIYYTYSTQTRKMRVVLIICE